MKMFEHDEGAGTQRGRNPARGPRLAGLMVLAVGLIPTIAFAGGAADADRAATRDHAARSSGLEDELAKGATRDCPVPSRRGGHRSGLQLGWLNGSGNRILTGCVSHPTAGAMG